MKRTLLGFAVGAGLLLAGGAGVAAAAPGESDQGSGVSTSSAADPGPSSSVSRTHPGDKTTSVATDRGAIRDTTARAERRDAEAATASSDRSPDPAATARRADNGTRLQVTTGRAVEDPQSGLASLSADLARAHDGVEAADPSSPSSATTFGNFEANLPYRQYQGSCGTCVLMSVAGVIGQLSADNRMPDRQEIIKLASEIPSDVVIGQNIYEPESDGDNLANKHKGASFVDAVTLLGKYDIDAEVTEYSRGQGKLAMNALKAALTEGQGVIVNIHNMTAYTGYNRTFFGSDFDQWGQRFSPISPETYGNHAVIVLEVDERHGMVYLNDSAPVYGKGMPIPIAAFMEAWQASRFQTLTARRGAAGIAPQLRIAA